jgi:peptide deformylase
MWRSLGCLLCLGLQKTQGLSNADQRRIAIESSPIEASLSERRRRLLQGALLVGSLTASSSSPTLASLDKTAKNDNSNNQNDVYGTAVSHPFVYSTQWTGTCLPRPQLTLTEAVESAAVFYDDSYSDPTDDHRPQWLMAKWPDPILRTSAKAVEDSMLGSNVLRQACACLQTTAEREGAVGLAAQQCGVNARIIYLKLNEKNSATGTNGNFGFGRKTSNARDNGNSLTMINPRILSRSNEADMLVWRENCLVLPPTFEATVLRDAWIDVAYQEWDSTKWSSIRLYGEDARAAQHEMDHDRGILVTDHVALDELETDLMRLIERPGHEERMAQAYKRYIG